MLPSSSPQQDTKPAGKRSRAMPGCTCARRSRRLGARMPKHMDILAHNTHKLSES